LYLITGFVTAALIWAHFSRINVVVEARGSLLPEGYARPVQAVAGGRVQSVRVREGSAVDRGQVIAQLDGQELRARAEKLRQELGVSEEQFRQCVVMRGPGAECLERQNRVIQLKSEITAMELALSQTTIAAPVAGVITRLEVRGPGAVVQAGQPIAVIAPANARLIVEAQVANKDIAFVEKGRPAELKFDAFPFQDYGGMRGTIIDVAPDAQFDEKLGSFYKVTIATERTDLVAKGKTIPLRPGLTLTAEIITERKSMLSLLLEPFRKLKGELRATT
jgi:multidrug efflux pump subunit AcrA (membrane-fusion protein)